MSCHIFSGYKTIILFTYYNIYGRSEHEVQQWVFRRWDYRQQQFWLTIWDA